jgi:NAD(P)-dependent dehydrogenase (short-subunit alcohol dehydrogenase family)
MPAPPTSASRPLPALVTGAGRGIGRAIASALAAKGHPVALVARSRDAIEAAARAMDARSGRSVALALPADVTDDRAVREACREALSRFGEVGILVNAAGIAESAPYEKTDAGLIRRHLEVNLLGAHHVIAALYPSMVARGEGAIVNVASIAGLEGFAYVSAYTASKHALVGLTRAIAAEAAPKGVRVNALCPGYVDTPMIERSIDRIVSATGRSRAEARETLGRMNPGGRLLTAEEVAFAALWILSEPARTLNGQVIVVDGMPAPWDPSGDAAPARPVNPDSLGPPRGYSNGMLHQSGRTLFVAGQVAWDRDHRIVGGDDLAAQFDAALANVLSVVEGAGGRADQIGRLRIYVTDRERYRACLADVGRAYRRRMGSHYPAMALVEVRRLLEEGALVEIEAEAIL